MTLALLPVGAKLGEAVDTVIARAYRHPVLPDRVVVRLVAETVAAGDELEMETLGFAPGEARGKVGVEKKRPLGFPGWALVHDPKHARHALAVVKELKLWQRRAKTRPGAAKDGIDAIAARLGKTVPQFLPAFYEEAGRAFLEHGSPSYAAVCFGKAREAELVHALDIDEQHRVDGFLEFALAGAVTTKALGDYAKQLGETRAPGEAYAHFRALCVGRTLGGMPPWAGMAKELRRLAIAAKLDPDAEDEKLVAEIIESPALGKAAGEFWRAYGGPIAQLAKSSPAIRAALLDLFPSVHGVDDAWLDLVDLATPPRSGWAGWFDKLVVHLSRHWRTRRVGPRAFAILRALAPALAAAGTPIACASRYGRIDLDLAELALELGVPVTASATGRIDLEEWMLHAKEPERGRDPVRVSAHPLLGPLLAAAAGSWAGPALDAASRGMAGFVVAKRAWLAALVDRVERGGLVDAAIALDTIARTATAQAFAELPDLHAKLAAATLAPALARTLRIGAFDEFGWPALEAVAAELGDVPFTLHGALPAVVVATKTRLYALDATSRLAEHDLVLGPRQELSTARYIGGQFLVVRRTASHELDAYWSGAPHVAFDAAGSPHWMPTVAARAVVLPDGAWLESHKAIRAGDRCVPGQERLGAHDGTTAWTLVYTDGALRLRELTAGGAAGRASWPAFLEPAVDWTIDAGTSYVLATPLVESPLGVAHGLLGIRRRTRGATQELARIDGAAWRSSFAMIAPAQLLVMPADGAPRPVVVDDRSSSATIYDVTGLAAGSRIAPQDRRHTRGSAAALPVSLWHALVARDPAGSARLRAITDADAAGLLAGAAPPVAHPLLAKGIAGLVEHARELEGARAALCRERAPDVARASVPATGAEDAVLRAAIGPWLPHAYGPDGRGVSQIARVAELFGAADRSDRRERALAGCRFDWMDLALAPNALVTLALAIGTPPDKRRAIAELHALIARHLPPPERLRVYGATSTMGIPDYTVDQVWFEVRWHAGNAYAIRHLAIHGNQYRVLEYAPDGNFKAPPGGLQPDRDRRGTARAPVDLAALLGATTTSWSAAAAARLAAATGLTPGEAALLWAGCPNLMTSGANFLPKELRETLGLKAKQAGVARDALRAYPLDKRRAVIDAAGCAGVAALLDGSAVGAMIGAWNEQIGARVPIPEALVATADHELETRLRPTAALAMLAAPDTAPELNADGIWALTTYGSVIRAAAAAPLVGQPPVKLPPPAFTEEVLDALVAYLPLLFAELPVGDPLRGKAVVAHERALARLASPGLLLDGGSDHPEGKTGPRELDALVAALGGEPFASEGVTGVRLRGAMFVRGQHSVALVLRPAELDARASAALAKLSAMMSRESGSAWGAIEALRSADCAALVARIAKTPVPAGGWEQDPSASAPALVKRVAKQLELSAATAALYLQYLVLAWPTPKRLAQWNGWTAKQLGAANAELVAADLVVIAKRERAQRTHFLPGGWEARKSPHAPRETWKLLGALAPFHLQFERAWARIAAGDVPRYEKVKKK